MKGVSRLDREGDSEDAGWVDMLCTQGETAYDFAAALNYCDASGSSQLLQYMKAHIQSIHDPQYADWEASLTCGTTSALEIVFRILCDSGCSILAEEFTYTGAIQAAKPLGINVVGVRMDDLGMIPEDIESTLCDWQSEQGPKPSVLYTIPTGQNPTGVTQTRERRLAIYEIAERHDLIIVEDDPYYFLQLCCDSTGPGKEEEDASQQERYLSRLPASYLSLDCSGRVIRLETTSKILAPGLRVGTITACRELVQKFIEHTNFSTSSPAGPSQVLLYKLLAEKWGQSGFISWLQRLSSQYWARLQILVDQCRIHLPADLCYWRVPEYGMFLWVKIRWSAHPLASRRRYVKEATSTRLHVEDRIYMTAREYGVQLSKGSWFAVLDEPIEFVFLRLTFAAASHEDDLMHAIARLGRALRVEFLLDNDRDIDCEP